MRLAPHGVGGQGTVPASNLPTRPSPNIYAEDVDVLMKDSNCAIL